MYQPPPFHLAFPVDDLAAAREFYTDILGCTEGRSSDTWIDFDLYGHQIVAHLSPYHKQHIQHHNEVDNQQVPVPHFGVILDWNRWHDLAEHLQNNAINFIIEPGIRFAGQTGEQATMFFLDPAGNALEFKAFRDPEQIFSK